MYHYKTKFLKKEEKELKNNFILILKLKEVYFAKPTFLFCFIFISIL